jgi:hypothetical protein
MGELLQILSAAKSIEHEQDLTGTVNHHTVQIATIQQQLNATIDAHNGALAFQMQTLAGVLIVSLIAVGIVYSIMDRKIRKLQAQLNPISTGQAA